MTDNNTSENNSKILFETTPIQKSDNSQIRVSVNEFNKSQYVDFREYFFSTSTQNYLPTKKGFTLSVKTDIQSVIELKDSLEKVIEYLENEDTKEIQRDDNKAGL